ncbi:TonB-dependent copper receptor [Craterilacuibacter sinensis]|uniref:TonB-dependent copper receptor n=1 Tax=Craterilacuibacter sinensis TaxID=2686017 RepID=A0A845BN47_9NEIS|nr:TonB-dependent copper receptor [Craterilacuibacter sinensis]MXR37689.1 TonB-dependent copper receptor [Craterilacuibacter sinensis]
MQKTHALPLLPLILSIHSAWAEAPEIHILDEIVVTGARTVSPLVVTADPQAPHRPVAAADAADFLKTVPGMSSIRKGGASSDPLLRGLGGSRLAVQADGHFLYGGCGGRMDPPTAYIVPSAYDLVEVIKGPQSVKYGMGLISGAVNFERKTEPFAEAGTQLNLSATGGNFDRNDAWLDATVGSQLGYVRAIGTQAHGGDYQDGNGDKVHSAFDRHSATAIAGFTPDADTTIELSADRSRGEAAYADRSMDGTVFDRDAWGIKAERRNLTPWLAALRAEYGHSYVDHVMDNFSLRPQPGMKMLSNPDRETDTARVAADLKLARAELTVGADWLQDDHTFRGGVDYAGKPRSPDQSFDSAGVFAEGKLPLGTSEQLVAGLRHDRVDARYDAGFGNAALRNTEQHYNLTSGFVRLESRQGAWTPYIGLGIAQRAPDFWERAKTNGAKLNKESNTELDFGTLYRNGTLQASVSGYLSRIDDFILLEGKPGSIAGSARNVDARRAGFEADANWRFAANWHAGATLSYAWGENRSDGKALAQTPPLEGLLTLGWENDRLALAAHVRGVARQGRVAPGQGNIVGTDLGESSGFATVGLKAGYQLNDAILLSAGVDNLLDRAYAEALNKGEPNGLNPITGRINEPGRTLWLQVQGRW